MDYLQTIVYRVLLKNHGEIYARDFVTERMSSSLGLWNLDDRNLAAVAAELGCSRKEFDNFMMIDRAIRNSSPCR